MTQDFEHLLQGYRDIADKAVDDALRLATELEQEQQRANKLSAQLAAAVAELKKLKGE